MAEGRVIQTGMSEARRTVERLPQAMRIALRAVAMRSAHRIAADAARRLRAQTRGSGETADAISVREEHQERAFLVESKATRGRPANLPFWLEFGTSKMSARPYMRPSAEAEQDRYRSGIEDAAIRTAQREGL